MAQLRNRSPVGERHKTSGRSSEQSLWPSPRFPLPDGPPLLPPPYVPAPGEGINPSRRFAPRRVATKANKIRGASRRAEGYDQSSGASRRRTLHLDVCDACCVVCPLGLCARSANIETLSTPGQQKVLALRAGRGSNNFFVALRAANIAEVFLRRFAPRQINRFFWRFAPGRKSLPVLRPRQRIKQSSLALRAVEMAEGFLWCFAPRKTLRMLWRLAPARSEDAF